MRISRTVFLLWVSALFLFASCASRKHMAYLHDVGKSGELEQAVTYEPTLKPDDLLSIIITAETPEATIIFNIPSIQGNYEVDNNQNGIKTYLIDNAGNIDFPVIGKIKIGGLTRAEAVNKISSAVSHYIKDPIVNLRILNFKISVLGEVAKPNSFNVPSERITLLEALSMAGDMTIYGRRDNVLVVRESDGRKTFTRVDITNSNFMNSPFYYLTQNDVVVVEPNKTRMNASAVGPNFTLLISAASLLTSLIIILTR